MSYEASRERTSILEDLGSADEEIRRLGVERLLTLALAEAIPKLVECLGDSSWRVRKAAVERLVACPEVDRVALALIGALADGENPGRRNSAVEALMAQGRAVTLLLLDALATDDIDVRKLVVDALAGIGDPAACDAMISMLADDDPNVRAAAADALGVLGGEAAERSLLAAAVSEEEDQLVRFSALRALARLECAVPASALGGVLEDPVLLAGGLVLLGSCEGDEGAVQCLLKGLASTSRAPREAAMGALLCQFSRRDGAEADDFIRQLKVAVRATDGLLETAVERLETADLSGRLMLIQFLGLAGAEASVVPILECARDEAVFEVAMSTLEALGDVAEHALDTHWAELDSSLRRNACDLLARSGGERGSTRLAEALEDADGELRMAAARALGERGAVDMLPALVRRLEVTALDDDPDAEDELEALGEALVVLVRTAPTDVVADAIDLLVDRMHGGAESVRRTVARAFVAVGRPQDFSRMAQLLKDPSPQVRRLAVEGLTRLDSGEAAEPLRLALADESPLVRIACAAALGGSRSEDALEDLGRLVRDEDPRVRAAALRAIGEHCALLRGAEARNPEGEALAIGLLGSQLALEEKDGMVTMAALEALDRLGGTEVATLVVQALASEEPEVLQVAVACIGRHGDDASLAELIPVVQHRAWAVRAEAIQALGERCFARALPAILRRLETEQDSFVRDVIMHSLRKLEG